MTDQGKRYPLDRWIKAKIGDFPGEDLNVSRLREYQIGKIRDTIFYAKANSGFYRELLQQVHADEIRDWSDLSRIPFTGGEDILDHPQRLVCVNQNQIHRIVTLNTSGTTGQNKRIFFTEEDQELTADYFHHGMETIVGPGDRVLILMPGARPGSVGDLLLTGLSRFHCRGIPYGFVDDYDRVLQLIFEQKITGIVGIPTQVYQLARLKEYRYPDRKTAMKSILLSADYSAPSLVKAIKNAFHCAVFDHYGMTEMGLGGGLECDVCRGYHLREADLYFEIIDPETKEVLPDGCVGEIVFTTLTRKGMPLIRYRTGDLSRFLDQPCTCGTRLKTLQKISGRLSQRQPFHHQVLTINMLDDVLFNYPRLLDYEAVLTEEGQKDFLTISAQFPDQGREEDLDYLHSMLMDAKIFAQFTFAGQKVFSANANGKRKIRDLRG
ncbi:DVU_1553 family AMP-dependent CoA ligase [Candidatus Formimonas warabiya]|uniref:AMP-dependent synthetase/ligase domain-containing protein n=1 Tax=Formimonas warabiya TaxID=1761012 RepID=A0A3G1KTE8_FORW1|nr:AMP-binding protein [Candidatus Formimonas warabiya]ATW25741.1 hypothetical protein DCMF_14095 [Candidatus Formimonas warabiya]